MKHDMLALWFEYLRKKHYHCITGNQINKTMIKEDHTITLREKFPNVEVFFVRIFPHSD